jgi:ABC-type phosphate/phosphonate transport system permease subunit
MKTIIFFILVVLAVTNPISNGIISFSLNGIGNGIHWVADQVDNVQNKDEE